MTRIRNAEMDDFEEILRIYAYARSFMAKTGNPTQWGNEYPAESLLKKDIAMRRLFVVTESRPCPETVKGAQPHGTAGGGPSAGVIEDLRPHGVFMFAIGEDPTYLRIEDGGWLSDSPYGVIHRIAGDGEIHGLLRRAVEYCGQRIHHLRIDTHADNKIMRHTIQKNGFVRCGIVHMEDGSPRIAYERI